MLNRLTDWFLVIPYLPLAIVLATVLPPTVPQLIAVIIVIGVTVLVGARPGWSGRRRWPSRRGPTWSGPGRWAPGTGTR